MCVRPGQGNSPVEGFCFVSLVRLLLAVVHADEHRRCGQHCDDGCQENDEASRRRHRDASLPRPGAVIRRTRTHSSSRETAAVGPTVKLHCWVRDDPHRRFDDLFNLVADPAFLPAAWDRVRGNKGARPAGVDGRTARSIEPGMASGTSSTGCGRR
ncbi:hypothetical protein STPH1_7431 [Streptomyces sp. OM5714]|nr:hypothetical protein STPH1_7431 [Streptomyces sp. OM5714]